MNSPLRALCRKVCRALAVLCAALLAAPAASQLDTVRSGALWPDTDGRHINAHGGCIVYHDGTYYWYGEHKADSTNNALVGVMCYSSPDLRRWTNRGAVLKVEPEGSGSDIERGCIVERPKVIYNEKTRRFVMWFHLELKGQGYNAARTAVAVATAPTGPFRFLRSERVNAGQLPFDMTAAQRAAFDTLNVDGYKEWNSPAWRDAVVKGLFLKRDLAGGQMARDMQLFVDDDGKAYHIFASEENLTLHIAELSDNYLSHTGKYVRVAPGGLNEAPVIFKHGGTYWLITSGCTGWAPNKARMFSAPSIWGPWTQHPNPCRGTGADRTFGGQGTFALPLPGKKDAILFMADQWRPSRPIDGRYIWLPVSFIGGQPVLEWTDAWTWSVFGQPQGR